MTAQLAPPPVFRSWDNLGLPLVGGKLFTYVAGTTTPQATYIDSTQTTQNTNPIVLNFRGEAFVWLDPTRAYKFVLQDAFGNLLWTEDNIPGSTFASSGSFIPTTTNTFTLGSPSFTWANAYFGPNAAPVFDPISGNIGYYARTIAEIAASITPTNFSYAPLNPWRYGADGTGGAADTTAYAAVRSVLAKISSGIDEWRNGEAVPGYPLSIQETNASITVNSSRFAGDGDGILVASRYLTEAQIADIQAGTLNATTQAGVAARLQAAINFLEGRTLGAIATLGSITPGSGYTNGTYNVINFTGGHGVFAFATIVVAGGVVSTVTLVGIGNGYQVGDVLTVPAASIGGTGSGFSIPVATLQPVTGKTNNNGGTLILPSGAYYLGSTTLRLGGNVHLVGSHYESATLNWAAGYTGDSNGALIEWGPDLNGKYGYSGYYTMGSAISQVTVNVPAGALWAIYTTGVQQGCYISDVKIVGANNGGVYIQDLKGSAYCRVDDLQIIGGQAMSTTSIGMRCQLQSTIQIRGFVCNGGGNSGDANKGNFHTGIQCVDGGHWIEASELELCDIGIDILAGTGGFSQAIDRGTFNCFHGQASNAIGIHIASGYQGSWNFRALTIGTQTNGIKNDVTGYLSPAAATVPSYIGSGIITDHSFAENTIVGGVYSQPVPSGSTFTLDIGAGDWFLLNITTGTFTVAAPVYGASTPGALQNGREITVTLFDNGAGANPTPTWNAAWHVLALTAISTGQNISAKFRWTGSVFYQVTPWTAAVAN